jgi:lysozyme family protein
MANFDLYFPKYLKSEGGFVEHPNDPGGATNFGITIGTFRTHYGQNKTVDDLKNIHMGQVRDIVKRSYWDVLKGDQMSSQQTAELVVDHGVNAGPSRAAKMLQFVLNRMGQNIQIDGAIGPITLGAISKVSESKLNQAYSQLRQDYYKYRANQTAGIAPEIKAFLGTMITPSDSAKVFLAGWLNRVSKYAPVIAGAGALSILALIALSIFIIKNQ